MTHTTDSQLIYLLRHGRTHFNAEGRLRGRADPVLDDEGRRQVGRAAAALAATGAVGVVTSPLSRAAQTAASVEGHLRIHQIVDHRLIDRDYGPQTGLPATEVEARWGSLDDAPGVESAADLLARARRGLEAAAAWFSPDPLVVVSHDAVIRALLGWMAPGLRICVPTASWQVLQLKDGVWTVLRADCTADEPEGVDAAAGLDDGGRRTA